MQHTRTDAAYMRTAQSNTETTTSFCAVFLTMPLLVHYPANIALRKAHPKHITRHITTDTTLLAINMQHRTIVGAHHDLSQHEHNTLTRPGFFHPRSLATSNLLQARQATQSVSQRTYDVVGARESFCMGREPFCKCPTAIMNTHTWRCPTTNFARRPRRSSFRPNCPYPPPWLKFQRSTTRCVACCILAVV